VWSEALWELGFGFDSCKKKELVTLLRSPQDWTPIIIDFCYTAQNVRPLFVYFFFGRGEGRGLEFSLH